MEEKRSGHRITITVVSVDFVLMYNTGMLVETLALKRRSSRKKSFAELCRFSQFSFVQNKNCSERVCSQRSSKIRTLYGCFSLVKSFLEKEEVNDLDKKSESTSRGEQQQSSHAQHLKMKRRFYKQSSLD